VLWVVLLKQKIENYKRMRIRPVEMVSLTLSAKREKQLKGLVSLSPNSFFGICDKKS
jgi:hypothetical protein